MEDLKISKNNKFFFLPVNTGYGLNGEPDDKLIDFYHKRSGNRIHCSIVGNVVIPNGYGSNEYCLFISKSDKWKILSDTINNNNTLAGIQLSTTWPNYIGNKNFVTSSSSSIDAYLYQLKNINTTEIDEIITRLEEAINISIDQGFRHIQLHAAHGYFFSLLIDNLFCTLSSYALEKIHDIFLNIPKHIETSLRFSLLIGIQHLDKLRHRKGIIKDILNLPFDYFDISFGFYNINKHMIYPETESMLSSRIKKSIELSIENPNKKFIISGRSIRNYNHELPENIFVGICRDIIANPKFLVNSVDGCNLCGDCHYYSRGESHLSCGRWQNTTL
ncbi:hypothetical protein NUN95_001508 [Klebsiella aerogenes]|uniref:hypothetical protein n=1 Tax=Klebsiella aerogenes TaxID=548 RepID=UPI000ABC8948|nr:hypothetical protein [Klebsiella aerogenes]EKU6608484.1 hypothetical protein [Klebsiella aerogenes]